MVKKKKEKIFLQCGRPGFSPWVGKIHWSRAWQPTPVFFPGEFHGQRSLVSYSPWGCKELDRTKRLPHTPCLERDPSHLHKTNPPIPWLSPSPVSHCTFSKTQIPTGSQLASPTSSPSTLPSLPSSHTQHSFLPQGLCAYSFLGSNLCSSKLLQRWLFLNLQACPDHAI